MQKKSIRCVQCGEDFTLSVAEQRRIARQGFDLPKRCPYCRKYKQKFRSDGGGEDIWLLREAKRKLHEDY